VGILILSLVLLRGIALNKIQLLELLTLSFILLTQYGLPFLKKLAGASEIRKIKSEPAVGA
jgi:hypothetical protein